MAMMEWKIFRTAIGQNDISIILCDDDPVFLKAFNDEIAGAFAKLNVAVNIGMFGRTGEIPAERLRSCDMAFLDIDFEDEVSNGIDIARKLREVNKKAMIFFVTNFIDYAPAGYEVQAFRYILKRDRGDVLERYIMQAMEQLAEEQEYLRLFNEDESIDIPFESISYLEVLNHSVSIHTKDKSYTLYTTLSSLSEQLEKFGFLRVHKSYLVNMRFIQKFRSRECLLSDGTTLPVGERNYAQQKQHFLLWKGLQ